MGKLLEMDEKSKVEFHFLDRFKSLYKGFPAGKVLKSESPDFIINTDKKKIGIEITRIYNLKEQGERFSPQERFSIEEKIIEKVRIDFLQRTKIPLHVVFHFADRFNLSRKDVELISKRIGCTIEKSVTEYDLNFHFNLTINNDLPDFVHYININYFPTVTDSSWYSAKSKFLPNLTKDQIKEAVYGKEQKIIDYKRKVDKVFLLIIEGLVPESWFDKVEEIPKTELGNSFEKIFIMRNLENQLIEIK